MKYTLCIILYCLSSLSLYSQNLVLNSSFEQSLQPYCEGWYNDCGKEISCDPTGDCNTQIFKDSPGDSLVDQWCLLIYGHSFPFETPVDYYITGKTGTFVYQLKFWMNTLHMNGYGRLGILDHGVFVQKDSVEDLLAPWTEYILEDTITTTVTDTLVVRLAPGIGDFCLCDVYFDQVELTVLDSLSTQVEPVSDPAEIKVFPNPAEDDVQIVGLPLSQSVITILNTCGQILEMRETNGNTITIDLSSLPSGIYYYIITEGNNSRIWKTGKLVKI